MTPVYEICKYKSMGEVSIVVVLNNKIEYYAIKRMKK
jgi:hypothetical protein